MFCVSHGISSLVFNPSQVGWQTRSLATTLDLSATRYQYYTTFLAECQIFFNIDPWSNSIGRCLNPKPKGLGFDTETDKKSFGSYLKADG